MRLVGYGDQQKQRRVVFQRQLLWVGLPQDAPGHHLPENVRHVGHRAGGDAVVVQLRHFRAAVLLQRQHPAKIAGEGVLRPEAVLGRGEGSNGGPGHIAVSGGVGRVCLRGHFVLL